MATINLSRREHHNLITLILDLADEFPTNEPCYQEVQKQVKLLQERFWANATEADYAEDREITQELLSRPLHPDY